MQSAKISQVITMSATTTTVTTVSTPTPAGTVRRKNPLIPDDYEPVPVKFLDLGGGRKIAYRKFEGTKQPTLLYVPGFFASMNLPKTVVIEVWARKNGYSNVR